MRTARSRTTEDNFDFLTMASFSQIMEPPRKEGRFRRVNGTSFKGGQMSSYLFTPMIYKPKVNVARLTRAQYWHSVFAVSKNWAAPIKDES
ncbi:hypothetical protein [Leptothrix discophora]|uniref:Uncharacterized protein n=1 Tax=Leptothrix discophora TaxID=89 RepID=A0ABT9G870_LEPDI|nr:hypothetical protein [Leptothrix discophora]MDP4302684.1 hypothetical protein [Leptothrix discophora]